MSKQRGTFGYPGSKTNIRGWILKHFPEHRQYIEGFGGAASILVGKDRSESEVYNDLNGDCVEFFRAVKNHGDELREWVENTPSSRQLFNEYFKSYKKDEWPDDIVERAGRFLYIQHHAFGGKGVNESSVTFSISTAGNEKLPWSSKDKTWHKKIVDIEWLKERFQKVLIERLDYADLVEKYDHEDAFFYFDPPYVDVGDDYYQVEEGGFDHSRFVNTLHDMDAKWLVSYDQNLPPGLEDYRTISRQKSANISAQRPEKTETLTMNYDIDGDVMMSEYGQRGLDAFAD